MNAVSGQDASSLGSNTIDRVAKVCGSKNGSLTPYRHHHLGDHDSVNAVAERRINWRLHLGH